VWRFLLLTFHSPDIDEFPLHHCLYEGLILNTYGSVPHIAVRIDLNISTWDNPKSASLQWPSLSKSMLPGFMSVYNAALVQEVNCQNNLCRVESCQVLMESLKLGHQGMKNTSFAVLHHVAEWFPSLEVCEPLNEERMANCLNEDFLLNFGHEFIGY
jgi:hypothetical protein